MSQAHHSTEPQVDLREYLAILRLRKWTILLTVAVTVATALFFSFRQTPIYVSQAKVVVTPANISASADPQDPQLFLNLETEREVATSPEVAELAARDLPGRQSPQQLISGLTVQGSAETEVLAFEYAFPNAAEAQERSQAFAKAYLDYRRQQVLDQMLAASNALQQRIRALDARLQDVNRRLGRADEDEKPGLQSQANLLVTQISGLQQRIDELTPADELRVGTIIQPATRPSSPASPNHLRNGGLALFVGLVLGLGMAFLRERLDDRLRGRTDLETHGGAPVLAAVPRVPNWKSDQDTPVITVAEPTSPAAEAYRTLRTSLLFTASQNGLKVMTVTSAREEEGKTSTTANLGVALAQAGKRVILVSADLRKPRLHRFFGQVNGGGLTELLAGELEPPRALARVGVENLRLLPSGPVPGNPAELLSSEAMRKLLEELRQYADFILVDATPVLGMADALALAAVSEGVLLVSDAEKARRSELKEVRHQLHQVNAKVLGIVLNNFDPSKARSYPQYYGYYRPYSYDDDHSRR